jgi:SAM-dependent MidA family methyltransferase
MGESDITAHVEWSSLVQEAEAGGFSVAGLTDQHHFLTGVLAASPEWAASTSPKVRRALQTLLHPEMFGRSFQVLALSKGETASAPLSGFKFARDPRSQL